MEKCNAEIRERAEQYNVPLWKIAARLGINDGNFSRKMRKELSQMEREKILAIIEDLKVEPESPFSDEHEVSANTIFAGRLKTSLKLNGLSQTQFAAELGTTPQAISSYVKGKTTPNYDMLRNIARKLGVSIDFLLGR